MIWPVLWFFTHFWKKIWPWPLTLTTWAIECALLGCTLVPSMKCVGEIASVIWLVLCFFYTFFGKFDLTKVRVILDQGQGHRHLGHWMRLIGLYLGTKYEVCRWNSPEIWPVLWFFIHFWKNLTLTIDLGSMSSTLVSLDAPYWVVPWYQVWSL